jgi:hypothetical protein
MSKALLDEKPLLVMPQLACKVGLNESIVLQQVHYWILDKKKKNNDCYDDRYWVFNSMQEWQEQFPFWSIKTLNRIFTNLVDKGLLLKNNYNKEKYDRTLWYSIDYEKLENIDNPERENAFSQVDQMDLDKMTKCIETSCPNGISHNDQVQIDNLTKQIPETIPKTTPKTSTEISSERLPSSKTELINYYEEKIGKLSKDD